MRHYHRSTVCIIALLLTAFCYITFSGCGGDDDDRDEQTSVIQPHPSRGVDSVLISSLVESPDHYKGNTIEVSGEIDAAGFEGGSFLVLLKESEDSLICELSKEDVNLEEYSQLEDAQSVTILGEFDILAGILFLRECEVKQITAPRLDN